MTTWKGLKNDLSISQEDQNAIALEKDLIRAMVAIREEKGLTQSQLAEMCNVKQPIIARMEASVHSPQIDSLLKILTPLGYTLQIVPMGKKWSQDKKTTWSPYDQGRSGLHIFFTESSQKISTQRLTVLTICVILHIEHEEQKEKDVAGTADPPQFQIIPDRPEGRTVMTRRS